MNNNINVLSLKKLYASALVALSLGMLGCASTGSLSEPLIPISVLSNSDQSVAKVYFYRSHDHLGVFQMGKRAAKVNDGAVADGLAADRGSYMIRKLKPGTHKFTMAGIASGIASERIVNLEAGRSYFLAIAWNLGGVASLEFRDESSFKEDTQSAEQIRIVKCTSWVRGCVFAKVTQ